MPTHKEGCVDEFLNLGFWHFGDNRQRTRGAVREFLLSMPLERLSRLRKILVVATARHQLVTTIPYDVADLSCLRVVHLSPSIEQFGDSEVRAVVFEGLAYALALVDGLDENTAVQLANRARSSAEAGRSKEGICYLTVRQPRLPRLPLLSGSHGWNVGRRNGGKERECKGVLTDSGAKSRAR